MKKIFMLLSNPFEPDPRVYKEAISLTSSGYDVSIIAWDREKKHPRYQKSNAITINRCQYKSGYGKGIYSLLDFFFFYIYIFTQLCAAKIAAIHCHDLDTLPIGFILSKIKKTPLVYDAHELEYFITLPGFIRNLSKKIEKFLANKADRILIVNGIQRKKFLDWGIKPPAIVELKNCPELNFFSTFQNKKENGKIILGWIGFIQAKVGIEKALKAFQRLSKEFNNLELLLVGKVHPSYKVDFDRAIAAINEPERLKIIHGVPYEQVSNYYQEMDIAFMLYEAIPKYQFSTPTKLYEAMAKSIPVIATPIGDVANIIKDSHCGMIVNAEDADKILESFRILIENPKMRQEMGKNGYLYARKNYTWEIMQNRLWTAYRKMLDQYYRII